jgi:photosystem II stability/assembly factor-like uncharacterized protein
MTRRPVRILSLVALALLVGALAAPTISRAIPSESLVWSPEYVGPNDIPVFEQDPTPVAGALDAVSFADATHGWAVGVRANGVTEQKPGTIDSLVAFTADGGSTWTSSTVGAVRRELHGVDAVAADDVWAVGDSGTIVHWNGSAWSTRSVPTQFAGKGFNAVSFFDSQHGWAVSDGRGVAYTGNGGATWTTIATPGTIGYLYGVAARSATSAFAVGDSGQIKALSTTSMTTRATVAGTLYSVTFADADHAWAVGDLARIYKSSDGGATWTAATRPLPVGLAPSVLTMRSVAFANRYDGVITGTYQVTWRTSNGGAAWVAQQIADPGASGYELRGVAFAGTVATPVAVGRFYGGQLNSDHDKARAYTGSWTGIPDPATVEATPPVTNSNRLPEYADSATIVLSATDEGSGVAHTYYVLDGGSQVDSTTVTVSVPGAHTLVFWSVDVQGNIESPHTVTFTVVTPPSSTGTPSTPSTPSTVKHAKSFTTFGYVARKSTTTKTISLQFYRSEHGRWVLRKTVTAGVTNFLTFSKYSVSASVPYTGKWRVRARNKVGTVYKYGAYRNFAAN